MANMSEKAIKPVFFQPFLVHVTLWDKKYLVEPLPGKN